MPIDFILLSNVVDPDPHQIYKLHPKPDQDPRQFADVKPKKCMECESILAPFQGFDPFF
jgi:hypothetical protein